MVARRRHRRRDRLRLRQGEAAGRNKRCRGFATGHEDVDRGRARLPTAPVTGEQRFLEYAREDPFAVGDEVDGDGRRFGGEQAAQGLEILAAEE